MALVASTTFEVVPPQLCQRLAPWQEVMACITVWTSESTGGGKPASRVGAGEGKP